MKLSVLRFARELEVSGLAQSARFLIKASEGWDLTVTPLGVIGKHERRPEDLWVPLGNCLSGEILAEEPLPNPAQSSSEAVAPTPHRGKPKAPK